MHDRTAVPALLLVACAVTCALACAVACTSRTEVGSFAAIDGSAGPQWFLPEAGADATLVAQVAAGGADADADAARVADVAPSTARIAAGEETSCAIDANGGVKCWGGGTFGELGNGDMNADMTSTPVQVKGLTSGVSAIFNGPVAFCARDATRHIQCWGDSVYGVFNGTPHVHAITYEPLAAPGLGDDVAQIATGLYFHVALSTTGTVRTWGLNGAGQIGSGNNDDAYTPEVVFGLPAPAIAVGASMVGYFACAVTMDGAALCWGSNGSGQLGTGDAKDALAPVPVKGLGAGVVAVTAGDAHACALLSDASVQCWGKNDVGQLGDGSKNDRPTPAKVPSLDPIAAISAGGSHTCARTTAGLVTCWGDGAVSPAPVAPVTNAVEIAAGANHTCARLADDTLLCWGDDTRGQLGPFWTPGNKP